MNSNVSLYILIFKIDTDLWRTVVTITHSQYKNLTNLQNTYVMNFIPCCKKSNLDPIAVEEGW